MDMKYDRKFEEMKKYIPFLENMITRLESTSTSSSNPRQAQLDKIRSLRDLLSNKKKRMKMENLLKCEQVLVNLYAKVEQRDTLSGVKKADSGFSIESPTPKEKSDLEAVRNKLKTVAKRQESVQDTLPEILPRNEVDVGTSGTKEPALFQRRPNQQPSQMNNEESTTSAPGSTTKRNYTRVLISPDTSARRWSKSPAPADKPLFSRRSPRKSPRRYSPSYYKKERKKSQSEKRKDLNITLNVPEESLQSLNTKDILSRIINCSDGDVDIDTLRELRKQILTELQKTGAKDDISDLILKSYNNNKTKIKKSKKKVKKEIEEGELSDSESEAIESIYGSLVVKEPVQTKVLADKDTQPRKIQICLVINSDDNPETKSKEMQKQDTTDLSELVMYEKETTEENKCSADKSHMKTDVNVAKEKSTVEEKVENDANDHENKEISKESVANDNTTAPEDNTIALKDNTTAPKDNEVISIPEINTTLPSENDTITSKESIQFKANFYKPLTEQIHTEQSVCTKDEETSCNQTNDSQNKATTIMSNIESTLEQMEKAPEIPLLHDRTIEQKPPDSTLSEIDILQALKNEILSDITMPGTETTTPLLHQPKVIKVASAQEILPKKRISIENYKQKSASSSKSNLDPISPRDDSMKKTKVVSSLKLTDKECERFNIPNISFDDEDESLDDDDDGDILASDLYSDLAPKSPDHDDSRHVESTPPVIIPVEPVKAVTVICHKADVDMRTLPLLSPNKSKISSLYNNVTMSTNKEMCVKTDKIEHIASQSRPTLIDPRIKRELNPNINNQSPNPHAGNPERTSRHNAFIGIASNSTPNPTMTPNARTYEMTPTHQSFEIDQSSHNHKHVYVPTLTNFDFREREKSVSREPGPGDRRSRMDDIREPCWNSRDSLSQSTRYNDSSNGSSKNDGPVTSAQSFARLDVPMTPLLSYGRVDCPSTPNHPFGRLECPPTPNHPFGRLECPPTPNHYFGRTDCPPTPTHPFGRTDCPPTPSHPFGRSDCPPTPSHSFGRSDCPTTPSHPFGRSECPTTPSHPFGRSECPSTPSHPFGRTEAPPPLMLGLMDCSQFVGNDCSSTPPIFGRNECPPKSNRSYINSDCAPIPNSFGIIDSPQTPSHPFGRGETTKSSFIRSDFTQKYPKDPRLYRKPESESNSQYDERDRGYYKDRDRYRGSSYSSQKSYSGSDTYSNYERDHSAGRNSKYTYYSPEFRAIKDRGSRRETSKDYEGDGAHNKERRYNSDVRNYEEVGVRRTRPEDIRPSSRAHSVGRTFVKGPEHTLSVKSNAGRSFTIDTSIDSTFQKHVDRAKDILGLVNSFDARRERAASVGRSLAREVSVGRTHSQICKPKGDAYENKRESFRRASSVGREMFESDKRSFQEIKADFKLCKFSEKEFCNKYNETRYYKSKDTSVPNERSRKDIHERQRTEKRAQELSKSSYSPRKNYRDPRMRRQLDNRNDKRGYDAHGRKSGIVYSNDNIVTGSIMASGYGVKNYKIPKIKRVTEEKEVVANIEQDIKNDKESDKKKINDKIKEKLYEKQEKVKNKNKEVLKEKSVEIGIASSEVSDVSKSDENSERRQTRSSRKNLIESKADTEIVAKTKKIKKLIYNSDSDSGTETKIKNKDLEPPKNKDFNTENIQTKNNNLPKSANVEKNSKKINSVDLDTSFGIDELEMFPDNIVSDPDQINALIADLDDDLSTGKSDTSHNFTKEITLENMMENISSPVKNTLAEIDNESVKILDAIDSITNDKAKVHSEIEKKHDLVGNLEAHVLAEQPKNLTQSKLPNKDDTRVEDSIGNTPTQSDAILNKDENQSSVLISTPTVNNEDIDSTTEIEKNVKPVDDKLLISDQNTDGCSTPDSTINTDEILKLTNEENLLGSTNEVTSTELIDPKPCSSAKESVSGLDSIGNLLSILQDKSKIKELLSMLGESTGENEKIKKKLEKLSEIVSDDEDSVAVSTADIEKNNVQPSDVNIGRKSQISKENVKTLEEDQLSNENDSKLEDDQLSRDSSKLDDDSKVSDIEPDAQETDTEIQNESKPKKKPAKKSRGMKKAKLKLKKPTLITAKRITRATTATKPKVKKPPRELMQLQEDIKEMFIRDEVLSATGIRMCRLAKLVDEKTSTFQSKEESVLPETGPIVVLEKFKNAVDKHVGLKNKKKVGPKLKVKTLNDNIVESARVKTPTHLKSKPGPKSKTKNKKDSDPYEFELDSFGGDTNTEKGSDNGSSSSSDSENSLASSKSFGSTELLADIKKKTKRKRRGWQAGVIKSKAKKKKVEPKEIEPVSTVLEDIISDKNGIPDFNCFTDRNYCFRKNQMSYSCRLCSFSGTDIVLHYRNQHPHVEIPLSRMAPEVAKEAIEQCEEINFKAISKIPSDKYVCTFCYKEFSCSKSVLETFFWHIVSMHTGEYKQNCSKCVYVNECPFTLDIPPPPKDLKGQLIGFICKKCNFTQISLENLKTHVIVRHNDEQTAVYTINLSVMSKKALNTLLRRSESERPALQTSPFVSEEKNRDSIEKDESEGVRITRTSAKKANQLITLSIQSKITFEGDDNGSELSDLISETGEASVKIEKLDSENVDGSSNNEECPTSDGSEIDLPQDDVEHQLTKEQPECPDPQLSSDIFNYPHFKISHTETGLKEYFCCINGKCHFKTTLLISMKKHVQTKHSENWDGYCYVCKVIVTPQGVHRFRDCLQHYLDKHMDSFPIFERELLPSPEIPQLSVANDTTNCAVSKPYINVRPLSELITNTEVVEPPQSASFPIIQSVMSLGTPPVDPSRSNIVYPAVIKEKEVENIYKYEEHQAEVMSKKYYLVMQSMVVPENLIKIFKCSGRYCSYATGSTEEALAHATTHQRIGGSDALNCCYCNFDSAGNAVDLVMHVFKNHAGSQYCCQQCFYRATSSQTVGAHILRVHGTPPAPGSVLRTTATTTIPPMKQTMLTREQAVTYYICGHRDDEGSCKFRTYTADKFCDHLQQRHATATTHPCHLCSVHATTASELVQHMKSHGVKLYQCTWCVHGADNESELLAHVSAAHPDRQPQAYIRMITNKDGSTELRVLPLAFLNKHKVPSKDMALTPTKEHPVREAERSIEMEALIGPFLAQPTGPVEINETPVPNTEIPEEMEPPPDTKPPKDILPPLPVSVTAEVPQIVQPSTKDTQLPVLSVTTKSVPQDSQVPKVKTEPVEKQSCPIPDVVVLDSDDENASSTTATQQPAIDLSEDETAQTSKGEKQPFKMFPDNLFTCPNCRQVCKNVGGLKKHLNSCYSGDSVLKCPHCDHRAENPEKLTCHYVADHSNKNVFECGLCDCHLATENAARKHMRNIHKGRYHVTLTPSDKKGVTRITVNIPKKIPIEPTKEKITPKNTSIKTRFDPQEIDQLPINPILSHQVYCSRCEFSTKVRLNMVRHLQLHAEQQPVPQTAPVNPVPHLETNEKHFDRMVNLASSSVVSRAPDKPRADPAPGVALLMPAEAASRYPRYVPERQRHTCGAKGCSYISLDEAMLRCHWETLHSGTSDFHCVHCPPHQHLDTSKPLTATRILSHLKMHDATLYACSSCSYYHFKREALEKHLSEVHKGGRLMVVREESGAQIPSPSTSQNAAAPTMDLKPWQCGLCKFKSMLRGEVIDHCSKLHQSKMQYKCAYCPFRTSAIENISKHQANSHVGKAEEVFYYYYREGSISDEADGMPRWMKQRSKASSSETDVKVEADAAPVSQAAPPAVAEPLNIDLNIVKKEVEEQSSPPLETSIEDLCKRFGKFCDPNGIKFKCPLCSVIMEDTKEAMQSHLYEELNYRKWSCGHCSYKAFHKAGLSDHMISEHRRQYDHIELPTDINIERWVSTVLAHQVAIIDKYKENLAQQKIVVETAKPGPSTEVIIPKEPASRYSEKDLNVAFGSFGSPNGSMFCCPKCGFLNDDEATMRDHLEMELNKIRWCCSNCPENFQTYHEAQFHCKGHGSASRPVEAVRDPAMRAAWPRAALRAQAPRRAPAAPAPARARPGVGELLVARKRPAPDSDDDRREQGAKKMPTKECPYCEYKSPYYSNVKSHIYIHFNLKPYACGYCEFSRHNKSVVTKHITQSHPNKPLKITMTDLPPEAKLPGDVSLVTCLECQKAIPMTETNYHLHNNARPEFTTDDTVFKCCICLTLCKSTKSLQKHHDTNHIGETINYTLHRLDRESEEIYKCCYCNAKFEHLKDFKEHHAFAHNTLLFINSLLNTPPVASEGKQRDTGLIVRKRCARKSTTKLPNYVARKSTTKLPYSVARRNSYYEEGYSYYGTKPTPLQEYSNVTTLMSFCNMMMPFSMKQLSEHLNIEPKVLVSDIKISSV